MCLRVDTRLNPNMSSNNFYWTQTALDKWIVGKQEESVKGKSL